MPTAATAAKAAAAVVVGPGVAASDAILRGQLAQLRRQVRLQWCAVDASSAVTQEVRARQFLWGVSRCRKCSSGACYCVGFGSCTWFSRHRKEGETCSVSA